jgi:GTP-binding protein
VLPRLALVGRPNVGKSTLFNKLTRRRDALVADVPGLTRDRRYGRATLDDKPCMLIDTGGLFGEDEFARVVTEQADVALDEAELVLFIVDARSGLTAHDEEIVDHLRRKGCEILLLINKVDGVDSTYAEVEFTRLGLGEGFPISAAHGRGLTSLVAAVAARLPDSELEPAAGESGRIRTAVIGRPNVGKSTLINRLLGEQRQVVLDQPGTTRDAIAIPFTADGDDYLLIDTAGVRRKGKVAEIVEKYSVVKSLDAMEQAHVVVLMLDGSEGLVEQDLHVLQYAARAGCGVVIAVNKWDGLTADEKRARKTTLDRRLEFVPWAPLKFISALHGSGVGHLLREVKMVYEAGAFDVGTSMLNRILERLITAHPPPSVRGRAIKLRYAHKTGDHPPRIAVHGNQTQSLPASYVRYLENGFREALNLVGNPVRLDLKTGDNPYAGKRNELTRRQRASRKRVMRHRKRR